MQEDNINFEEIGKKETENAERSQTLFKQPVRGRFRNLYEELKVKCAPENFMNPYDPEKVSKANNLYSVVLATDAKDVEKLKQLRLRAMENLGIRFSTEGLFEKLTMACNPKNFTGETYDKRLLELANRLYQKVLKDADNILALEEIEKEAKELIETFNSHKDESGTTGGDDNKNGDLQFNIIAIILILIGTINAIVMVLLSKYR